MGTIVEDRLQIRSFLELELLIEVRVLTQVDPQPWHGPRPQGLTRGSPHTDPQVPLALETVQAAVSANARYTVVFTRGNTYIYKYTRVYIYT